MAKLSRKSKDMGRVVATQTIKSNFGESTHNIYENSAITWKEGIEVDYVGSQRVIVTTKAVN
ncbi:hypothetical protein [Bacillus phage vB_BanS-Thrax1]|nr:hypothetical protein [Bacillus phage vB_BanS-Thrax1]